jgi:hypothetical protein
MTPLRIVAASIAVPGFLVLMSAMVALLAAMCGTGIWDGGFLQ